MTAAQFSDIANGVASLALAVAVLVFVAVILARYRTERRDRNGRVGAPPVRPDE